MKVGLIVECGPRGAEVKVFPHLAGRLGVVVESGDIVPLGNKPKLIQGCGEWAAGLLDKGYDRVLIIWDLYPAWRQDGERPCRFEDRQAIDASLRAARADLTRIFLICITEELEAWLVSDGRAMSQILSRPTHAVRVPDVTRPDRERNPKGTIRRLFQQHRHITYSEEEHPLEIVRAMPDWRRVRRSESFRRFVEKLTGQPPV